jgi:hypothetical protein
VKISYEPSYRVEAAILGLIELVAFGLCVYCLSTWWTITSALEAVQ